MRIAALASLFVASFGAIFAAEKAAPKPPVILAVKAGRLIDPASGQVRTNQLIVIEDDKIKSVGDAADLK